MARRIRCPFNAHIQWFHPPIDTRTARPASDELRPSDQGMVGLDPDTWAMELGLLLERVWSARVGEAVMSSIRRRTTIYSTVGGAQTDSDPYRDEPEPVPNADIETAARLATTTGANAMMWIDIHGRSEGAGGGEQWSVEATLLHELVHAVNITWGNYQIATTHGQAQAHRLGVSSPEEEFAWIIDNMFRSERGMWLRGQYEGGAMLPPGTTRIDRPESEARVVARCRSRVPQLAARLAEIDRRTCGYNPFHEAEPPAR